MKNITGRDLVQVITDERFEWERDCLGPLAFQSKKACQIGRAHV